MRIKCKNCKKFIEGICEKFGRKRSSGRRRDCSFFDARPPRQRVNAPYFRFISREERRKIKEQDKVNKEKAKIMQRDLEQRKLFEASLAINKTKPQEKIRIKKPSLFKRLFNRQKVI